MDTKKQNGVMHIRGKIIEVDTYGTGTNQMFSHQITIPGDDEFDGVSGIIVNSPSMLGAKNQILECDVKYKGFVKRFQYVERETGEQKKGKNLQVRFSVVEENKISVS